MRKSYISVMAVWAMLIFPAGVMAQGEDKQGSPFGQEKFVPDISFIADFSALYRNLAADVYEGLTVPGFTEGTHEHKGHGHAAMNEHIGFNFNYAEMALFSAVDPYFELFAVFHLTAESFEVEEVYASSTALPWGFRLKAGKFLSNFGRHNPRHAHQWYFADAPLVSRAFFGDHGLNEIGLQAAWVAPLDFFLQAGFEAIKGDNEVSFGSEGYTDPAGTREVKDARGPNCYSGFIRTSFDAGDLTFLAGGSFVWGRTRTDDEEDGLGHAVTAETWIAAADLTVRYTVDSYRYVLLETEFLFRRMVGTMYEYSAGPATEAKDLEKEQWGMYAQFVVKPLQAWRFGGRFDLLGMNRVVIGGADKNLPWGLWRLTGMIDFIPSEFTLLRLQYGFDHSVYDGDNEPRPEHRVLLQFNVAIGAHGAHPF